MLPRQHLITILGSVILLSATAGIGWGLVRFKANQSLQLKNKKPPEEVPVAVAYDLVTELDHQQSTSVIGTIVAPKWMNLRTEASGRVVDILIQSGQVVKSGELLIALDTSVEQASLKAAKAKLKIATSTKDRLQALSDQSAVSSQELEQSQFEMETAMAEIERLNAIIDKRNMRAPYDARVGLLNVSVGQYLAEGVELATLTGIEVDEEDTSKEIYYVDFAVPQYVAPFIEVDQKVKVKALQSTLDATIRAVDARSDRQTRNLMVRAEFNAPPTRVSANDSVNVLVSYGPRIRAMVVPASAVLRSPTGSFVYTINKDADGIDRVALRQVKSASTIESKIVILEGLSVDERIVSQGAFKLRPGLAVKSPDLALEPDATERGGSQH